MARTFKKQLFLQLAIAIGLTTIFIVVTGFVGSDISDRAANISAIKQQAEFEQQALQSLIRLTEGEKRAEGYTSRLDQFLPEKDSLFSFKNKITDIGREERMVLGFKFGTENPPSATAPASVTFQISASGSAAGFERLVERLETSGYFIRITLFDVAWAGKPGSQTFTGSISGKVFYRG